jgi:hypothetical protein
MGWWDRLWSILSPPHPERPPSGFSADSDEIVSLTAEAAQAAQRAAEAAAREQRSMERRIQRIEAMLAVAQHRRIEDDPPGKPTYQDGRG